MLRSIQLIAPRIIDVLLSTVILVLISPLLSAIAVAIRLDSKGPIFHVTARRRPTDGRVYRLVQFRTLEYQGPQHTRREDTPRLTRYGSFLRRTSLDTLPHFFNVLAGNMTLVRRPTVGAAEVHEPAPWQRDRTGHVVARAERWLSVIALLVPRRLRQEEIDDARELIHALATEGRPGWRRCVAIKLASTTLWVLVNALRDLAAALLGSKST